jgi:hypothetical protein
MSSRQLTAVVVRVREQATASTIYCSAEWHFANFKSTLAPLIYNLSLRLTYDSKTFRVSIPTMSRYFGVHVTTARKAIHELRDQGWLEETYAPLGRPVEYRVVEHKEWAKRPRAKCCEKLSITIADPLGKRLYGITGLKYFANYLTGLRKRASDEQIVHYCKELWDQERKNDVKPKGFYGRLYRHIDEYAVLP